MKKINVTICTGTLCHVLGGSELPAILDYLPKELVPYVEIKGSTCINHCKNNNLQPPFAEVNGELICNATIEKLVNKIIKITPNDLQ